ncbi:unnamed protein product [Penicillium camemberti]|uniref:Str. FM013 n=1 Tax=Penicillium camemberti (strain FM 013) TaxID=1429867 RepID=A0A0G4PF97_PENC3|nr:unnamed protein product [Penicillium camemberti]
MTTAVFIICQTPLSPVYVAPTLTLGNTDFSLFCADPTRPSCATYTWPGADLTDYVCDTARFLPYVYTVGTWGEAEDGTILVAIQSITKVDDDVMSMHSSSYDASTSVPKPNHQATSTSSMTVATTPAQQTAPNSSSSGGSTSAGTAGSVVGGVGSAGIIGADVIFLLWKRRKSHQQDGLNEPGNIRYESPPKYRSDHVGKGMQQPAKVRQMTRSTR